MHVEGKRSRAILTRFTSQSSGSGQRLKVGKERETSEISLIASIESNGRYRMQFCIIETIGDYHE